MIITNSYPMHAHGIIILSGLPVYRKKTQSFCTKKSQILKSNFEGFSETNSGKKQLISHEMHRNFQGNFEMLFTRQAVTKFHHEFAKLRLVSKQPRQPR